MTLSVTADEFGNLNIRTDEDGRRHRRVLGPGRLDAAGVWIDADISGEPEEVRTAAREAWTPQIKAAFRAMLEARFAAIPPPPTVDQMKQQRVDTIAEGVRLIGHDHENRLRAVEDAIANRTPRASVSMAQFMAAVKARLT